MAVASTSYLTIAEGRVLFGLAADDDTSDLEVEVLVDAASEWIDRWCNRSFGFVADQQERFPAPWRPPVRYLRRTPVLAVTSITDTSDDIALTVDVHYEVEDAENGRIRFITLEPNTGAAYPGVSGDPDYSTFAQRYVAVYSGGFETPNQTGTGAPALPGLIRMAAKMVFRQMQESGLRDPGVTREHLVEMSYWYDATALDKHLNMYLRSYRRWEQQ